MLDAISDRWSRLSHSDAVQQLLTSIAVELLTHHDAYFTDNTTPR